jgi:hypothetical protein
MAKHSVLATASQDEKFQRSPALKNAASSKGQQMNWPRKAPGVFSKPRRMRLLPFAELHFFWNGTE